MKLFIYRDHNGKKYPALLSRVIIAFLITLLSIRLLNGEITKSQFNSYFLFRFIVIVIVQEWIFRIHLLNSARFFDVFALWKYFFIQVILGVLLPTWLVLHYKSQLYTGSQLYTTKNELTQMDMALFYPHTILIINMIFLGCFLVKTQYTDWLSIKVERGEKSFTINIMKVAIVQKDEIIMSVGDEWVVIRSTPALKSALNNLDPKEFKVWAKKIIISAELLHASDNESMDSLSNYIDTMVTELREEHWVEFIKIEIARINNEKA
jgi:hypothetical protein